MRKNLLLVISQFSPINSYYVCQLLPVRLSVPICLIDRETEDYKVRLTDGLTIRHREILNFIDIKFDLQKYYKYFLISYDNDQTTALFKSATYTHAIVSLLLVQVS